MSEELKPCPFCGGELHLYPSHIEGDYIVNKPGGVCKKCGMIFEGRGYRIYGEVKSEDFHNEKFFELWNTRPAEDEIKAENEELAGYVKRFRETLAEVAKMAIDAEQEQIFEKCRDALRDVYLEEKFRDSFDKILHNPDTGKGGEDE